MKDYPPIPRSTGTNFREILGAYVFDKVDGSSMRSEWSRKRGWYKHGKRSGLVDDTNPHLVVVPSLFLQTLAEPLERIARDQRWQNLVVFYEFWGAKSLAGNHEPDDPKCLTLFDVAADKHGILDPRDFVKLFDGRVETARFLGVHNFTRGFVETIWRNELEGVTFEGVVAKKQEGRHEIVRSKAKTEQWITAVKNRHGDRADSIINS